MSETLADSREDHPAPASASTAEQFWTFAKQLASVTGAAAKASPEVLIKAGGKSHPPRARRSELAAELAALSEKLDAVRHRLGVGESEMVSDKDRDSTLATMRKMVRERTLVDSTSFVAQKHVTRQALSKALKANRVFYVEVAGQRYVPSFYLDPRLEHRQLEEVTKALGDLPGPSKLQFFATKKASLSGKTPIEALADGQYQRVRTAAQGFAER